MSCAVCSRQSRKGGAGLHTCKPGAWTELIPDSATWDVTHPDGGSATSYLNWAYFIYVPPRVITGMMPVEVPIKLGTNVTNHYFH